MLFDDRHCYTCVYIPVEEDRRQCIKCVVCCIWDGVAYNTLGVHDDTKDSICQEASQKGKLLMSWTVSHLGSSRKASFTKVTIHLEKLSFNHTTMSFVSSAQAIQVYRLVMSVYQQIG